MLFLANVKVKEADTTYTGIQTAFGHKEKVLYNEIQIFHFSFLNLLPYILVLVGLVLGLIGGLGKGKALLIIIATLVFFGAGVLFFFVPSFVQFNGDASSIINAFGGNVKEMFELAYGAIIAGICSLLAGVSSVFRLALK